MSNRQAANQQRGRVTRIIPPPAAIQAAMPADAGDTLLASRTCRAASRNASIRPCSAIPAAGYPHPAVAIPGPVAIAPAIALAMRRRRTRLMPWWRHLGAPLRPVIFFRTGPSRPALRRCALPARFRCRLRLHCTEGEKDTGKACKHYFSAMDHGDSRNRFRCGSDGSIRTRHPFTWAASCSL